MKKVTQDFYHTTIATANKIVGYTAVSDFNTLGIDLSDHFGSWSLQVSRSLSDGNPSVTIQCSDDNSSWDDYKEESTAVSVINGEIFIDDEFIPKYLRVQYFAGGGTGTVTMKLTLHK